MGLPGWAFFLQHQLVLEMAPQGMLNDRGPDTAAFRNITPEPGSRIASGRDHVRSSMHGHEHLEYLQTPQERLRTSTFF